MANLPIPKSYKQILAEFFAAAQANNVIGDLEPGSVMNTVIEMETRRRKVLLLSFLAALDNRFKKFEDPNDAWVLGSI